jgi:hypothetical protein
LPSPLPPEPPKRRWDLGFPMALGVFLTSNWIGARLFHHSNTVGLVAFIGCIVVSIWYVFWDHKQELKKFNKRKL